MQSDVRLVRVVDDVMSWKQSSLKSLASIVISRTESWGNDDAMREMTWNVDGAGRVGDDVVVCASGHVTLSVVKLVMNLIP